MVSRVALVLGSPDLTFKKRKRLPGHQRRRTRRIRNERCLIALAIEHLLVDFEPIYPISRMVLAVSPC